MALDIRTFKPLLCFYTCGFVFRPTARRKPEPVTNTGEALQKFGDKKAISSDMYFGKQDKSEVSDQHAFSHIHKYDFREHF